MACPPTGELVANPAGLQVAGRPPCFHWFCYCFLLVVAIIFACSSVGWLWCQLHLSLVSRFQCLLFVLACRGFADCFGLVCNGLACFSIVLSMVPAWFSWVGPWVGFLLFIINTNSSETQEF